MYLYRERLAIVIKDLDREFMDLQVAIGVIGRRRTEYEVITGPPVLRFTGIEIQSLHFGGKFERAGFLNSTLRDASFTDAHLEHASFTGGVLDGVYFSGTILDDVHFTGASFKDVTFEDTDLSRTHGLTQSQLDQCELIGHIPLPPGLYPPGGVPPGIAA